MLREPDPPFVVDDTMVAGVQMMIDEVDDHQIDLSRLGGLHALAAVLRRDSFKLLVQRKLLRQRVAQFGIIVDNENLRVFGIKLSRLCSCPI